MTLTFTINGNTYRTTELSEQDYQDFQYNTENDWLSYMKKNEVIILI